MGEQATSTVVNGAGPAAADRLRIPAMRWWIAGLLFGSAVLNYIDRQTLSILAPTIQRELGFDDRRYALVANLFLAAYTLATLLSGRVVERLGTRVALAAFVAWWSVANMLSGLVTTFWMLCAFRFLLGLGEAGNWTASPRAVSEWFPARERGVAIGLYTMGATVGATIAPVLVVALSERYGWQAAFVATGAAGLLWLVPWLALYRRPADHPRITDRECVLLAAEAAVRPGPAAAGLPWRAIVARRDVWVLMVARLLTDPVWYFYQFWLAKYLFAAHHVPEAELGRTWVVFLAADAGSLVGGIASGWLIRRGRAPAAARVAVMAACAALMPSSLLVARAESVPGVLGFAMVVVFAHLAWLINLTALVTDRVPPAAVATTFGVIAAGSALGGLAMNALVGELVTRWSYAPWFAAMAFLHPAAWLLIRLAGVNRPPAEGVVQC
jgi:ACS family hexuronate transporter-like MFS transporter